MASLFAITCDRSVDLAGKQDAEITVTISNQSGRSLQAQATVEALDPVLKGNVGVSRGDPKWEFADKGTHQITVSVKVPPGTPKGQYKFRVKVVNVEKPDEEGQDGPEILAIVPDSAPVPPPKFPWWILIVIGAVLLVGITVTWLALRDGDVEVPNVVGKPLKEALKILKDAGFEADEQEKVVNSPNRSVQPGDVAVQDPAPPEKAKKGSKVVLHVKGGATVKMPKLVGLTATTLISHLQGFTIGTITTKQTNTKPDGTVLSQHPAADTEVSQETKVDLVFEGKLGITKFAELVAPARLEAMPAVIRDHRVNVDKVDRPGGIERPK